MMCRSVNVNNVSAEPRQPNEYTGLLSWGWLHLSHSSTTQLSLPRVRKWTLASQAGRLCVVRRSEKALLYPHQRHT